MAAAMTALAGCANLNSINHRFDIPNDSPHAITVDARQRGIISNNVRITQGTGDNAREVERLTICAEQYPDVYTVLGGALGGSFSLIPADPSPQLQAAVNGAFNETGSGIQRTQTVNILREMMFRTCERFMNGGIDRAELSVQAARDVRAMVSILAIEQLTGLLTPDPTVISSQNSSTALSGAVEMAEAVIDARNALNTARTNKEVADAALAHQQNRKAECDEADSDDGEVAGAAGNCETVEADLEAAQTLATQRTQELNNAQSDYDTISSLSASFATATSRGVNLNPTAGGRGEHYLEDSQSVAAVTEAVTRIVALEYGSSNGLTACEALLTSEINFDAENAGPSFAAGFNALAVVSSEERGFAENQGDQHGPQGNLEELESGDAAVLGACMRMLNYAQIRQRETMEAIFAPRLVAGNSSVSDDEPNAE
ncbi:MAG TPA: hypothetical protein DDZ43_11810 [Hyphomonadaceae bacterium]|nr:hypothetical protein [Ponticaulis sp.]HBH88281.1 hypothetical protein [Hyphomonadaceae bacterium]HBJ93554.1 hypothetical protein [Hyphomonadaceae bacterium]